MANFVHQKNITKNEKESKIQEMLTYNHMLLSLKISGIVLLAVGGAVFSVLVMSPTCSSYEISRRDDVQYTRAPTTDTEESPKKTVPKGIDIYQEKPLIDMESIRDEEKRHVPGYRLHRQQPTSYLVQKTYDKQN